MKPRFSPNDVLNALHATETVLSQLLAVPLKGVAARIMAERYTLATVVNARAMLGPFRAERQCVSIMEDSVNGRR